MTTMQASRAWRRSNAARRIRRLVRSGAGAGTRARTRASVGLIVDAGRYSRAAWPMPASCWSWRRRKTTRGAFTGIEADVEVLRAQGRGARIPAHVLRRDGCRRTLPRHPGRLRRHRGAGLGGDAAAHVSALGRATRLRDRTDRGVGRRGGGNQERHRAFRGRLCLWLAAHRDRRAPPGAQVAVRFGAIGGTPRSPRFSSPRRSTTTSRWRSIRRICASTSIAPAARAASTSTAPNRPCASRTMPTGTRGAVPERPFAAQESRHGHEAVAGEALRAGAAKGAAHRQKLEESKADIGWGSQIRSYVLDQSRDQGSAHRASRSATRRRCSTAISTDSSRRASRADV